MKVGNRVICVCDDWWDDSAEIIVKSDDSYDPKRGDKLTISGISMAEGYLTLRFEEIPFFNVLGLQEDYEAANFRLLNPHTFRNKLSKKLANKPLVKEVVETGKELISAI